MMESQGTQRPRMVDHTSAYGHARARTTSSNNFPFPAQGGQMTNPQQQQQGQTLTPAYTSQRGSTHQNLNHVQNQNRRSPSVNTFSTASSFAAPAAFRTSSQTDLRRSISSRSGGTTAPPASGYVALLRKQKATVWCDRAQYEDPRLAHQQKVAKMRANLEVSGGRNSTYGSMGNRTNTGLSAGKVVGKIRHHGKTPATGYFPGQNHVGVGGVPLRLSATEVEAESSEEEDNYHGASKAHHRRTGSSGRSSTTSGPRPPGLKNTGRPASQRWSPGDTPERSGSLVEERPAAVADDSVSTIAHSTASGSSAERADNVGELTPAPRMASNLLLNQALTREKSVKNPDELRRRGSVDERTATLTSGRLFIANPD